MKKIFAILLVGLLVCGSAFAVNNEYDSQNVDIFAPYRGGAGITPGTEVVKVRYSLGPNAPNAPSLASGDVVVWDTTSADGYTITACVTSNDAAFAGVLVTAIQTADSPVVRGTGRNVGYMAIKGYCLVKAELGSTAGGQIYPSSILQTGGPAVSTIDRFIAVTGSPQVVSSDTGVLLAAPATAGALAPAWLN